MNDLARWALSACFCVMTGCGSTVVVGGGGAGGDATDAATTTSSAKSGSGSGSAPGSSGSGSGACSLVGTWDGISGIDGSNPSSSASYVFASDGTWTGGQFGKDPSATAFMHGAYAISGDTLTLHGSGMGPSCAASVDATYAVTFGADCAYASLLTKTDGCTGGRLWLSASSDGTAMTRRAQ